MGGDLMEKMGDDSYVMSMEEFLDMITASDTKEKILETKSKDVPLKLTSGQFAMTCKALVVHNIMMDTVSREEAELLMQFGDILEVALVEKFQTRTNKTKERKN